VERALEDVQLRQPDATCGKSRFDETVSAQINGEN
jgi:hypothetical protein